MIKDHVDRTEFAARPVFEIDGDALKMFLVFAHRSVIAGGSPVGRTPLVSGHEEQARLVTLKRAGLLATVTYSGNTIIHFTGAGRCLALAHGVKIPQ